MRLERNAFFSPVSQRQFRKGHIDKNTEEVLQRVCTVCHPENFKTAAVTNMGSRTSGVHPLKLSHVYFLKGRVAYQIGRLGTAVVPGTAGKNPEVNREKHGG